MRREVEHQVGVVDRVCEGMPGHREIELRQPEARMRDGARQIALLEPAVVEGREGVDPHDGVSLVEK
jgi:hypothetical protein